jgi:probable rRNA maturation factor
VPVYFHSEESCFQLEDEAIYRKWIKGVVTNNGKTLGNINVIFTTNDYLIKINKQFLKHNYHTDVITFDYNDENVVSGDIFVSVDQVRKNSRKFDVGFIDELSRVTIHGVLHLLGFNDESYSEIERMKSMENASLEWLKKY